MERRPTIVDVAREAGVSKSTVSLVLRDSPAIREETRETVRAAMSTLGYVYNRAAANLRLSGPGLIGLVINDLRNPFFSEFATSLQVALSEKGFAAVIANTGEDAGNQRQVIHALIEHGVSALIISPAYGAGENGFDVIAQAGIPAMQVLRLVDERTTLFPFAAPDYPSGSRIASRHLVRPGGRVAFVGGVDGRGVTKERLSGYRSVIAEAGAEPLIIPGPATRGFGREAAATLATSYPDVDAVLCFNDLVALGLLNGCAEIGRQVGDRGLRVVGFDDLAECRQSWPSLSSVRCDIDQFGRDVATAMLAWVNEGTVPVPVRRSPVSLQIRASSQ